MFFKKEKCSKCEKEKVYEVNLNKQFQNDNAYGTKGTHKITMANTEKKNKDDKSFVVKDIDKLSDLDYEILGRAFVNRLYSPYYDRYDCPCLEDFCENVCQQTEGELFAKNIEAEKNLE